MVPEKGKLVANKKFVFIINDQLIKYIQKNPQMTFIEFVY